MKSSSKINIFKKRKVSEIFHCVSDVETEKYAFQVASGALLSIYYAMFESFTEFKKLIKFDILSVPKSSTWEIDRITH